MGTSSGRQADQISLTFIALVRGVPDRVRLREHSLQSAAGEPAPKGVITGVYGAHSKQMALVIASEWSRENEQRRSGPNRALLIDAKYRIDNFQLASRQLATRALVQQSGWLHLDRLSSELREGLKQEWLAWVRSERGEQEYDRLCGLSLTDIGLEQPGYIERLLARRSPRLLAVVHPVRPALSPLNVVWAASVRYEKDRFAEAAARFLPTAVEV